MPLQPTVKYQGFIYPTEEECVVAQAKYLNAYERRTPEYKAGVIIDAYCLPFDAFPVKGILVYIYKISCSHNLLLQSKTKPPRD